MTNRLVIIQTAAAMARVKFARYRVVSKVDRMVTVLLKKFLQNGNFLMDEVE